MNSNQNTKEMGRSSSLKMILPGGFTPTHNQKVFYWNINHPKPTTQLYIEQLHLMIFRKPIRSWRTNLTELKRHLTVKKIFILWNLLVFNLVSLGCFQKKHRNTIISKNLKDNFLKCSILNTLKVNFS